MKKSITGLCGTLAIAIFVMPIFAYAAAPKPECVEFTASQTEVEHGDRVQLSWETEHGKKVLITPLQYTSSNESIVSKGDVTVFPKKDTRYTLTVSSGTTEDECSLFVEVTNDDEAVGATTNDTDTKKAAAPSVVVSEVREQTPAAAIAIAQLPYTGVDTTPLLSTLFFVLLAAWVVSVLYTVLENKRAVANNQDFRGFGSIIPHAEYHKKNQGAVDRF